MSSSSSSESADSISDDEMVAGVVMTMVGLVTQQVQRPIVRRSTINRNREEAQQLLVQDYFCANPTYNERMFIRRFRMRRELFLRISEALEQQFDYFKQKYDARGRLGFTSLQKCTAAIRQLAYGTCSDSFDDYLKMGEKTSRDSLYKFCKGSYFVFFLNMCMFCLRKLN